MDIRDTLLIVDDTGTEREALRKLFEENFNILEAKSGEQALLILEQNHGCIAAVLLDIDMPGSESYALLEEMKRTELLLKIPAILFAEQIQSEDEEKAFDAGAVDIITRPFHPMIVKHRVQSILALYHHKWNLEEMVEEQAESLRNSNEVIVDTLSSIIEYRSSESGQHILRIRRFTQILLEEVAKSCPEYDLHERTIQIIASASALHDIGKISIPDSILNKPGKLTAAEFELMKTHALTGCRMLEQLTGLGNEEYLRYAYNICHYHHERWDGNGYPEGLVGDEIPICAQAVGIADAYDALTTVREYKEAYSHERAVNMILNGECGQFSPKLLECFKQVRNAFAELASKYADGYSPKSDYITVPLPLPGKGETGLDTLQMARMKNQVLLHYMDLTAVEVDMDQGVYHILYNPNPDFSHLYSATSFQEALRNLVCKAVHPDDQEMVLEQSPVYVEEFFASGVRKRTRCYRVYNSVSGKYLYYDATMLRIDTGDMEQRKALVVWQRSDDKAEGAIPGDAGKNLVGTGLLEIIQSCHHDRWLTMDSISQRLISLLGYTKEEIQSQFHNRMLELVVPEERDNALRNIRAQLQKGNRVEVELKMRHKDGHPVWVIGKSYLITEDDGEEYLSGMLIDISQTRKAQEDLHRSLEKYQIIMEQTSDIIFEWDVTADTMICSSKWEKRFGYAPISDHISQKLSRASHFHPDDMHLLQEKISNLKTGDEVTEFEARIITSKGRYVWNRIRASVQRDVEGNLTKVLGVIIDIDFEKRSAQVLQQRAERDALTKLLNKSASQEQVEAYLSDGNSNKNAALLVIDLDNFKNVNDQYGHMFGDTVLAKAAEQISGLFRDSDVVARIGGDEFLVLMKDVHHMDLVAERCERLIGIFRNLYQEQLSECNLSCSIGVSFFPKHGSTFQELFKRADRALYQAKREGKNRYAFFSQKGALKKLPTMVNERIDSDEQPGMANYSMVHYAFERLYESGNPEETIQQILELIGKQMNVSRVYIFENNADNTTCSNTFEWCNTGILPEIDNLQNINYETDIPGFKDLFNEQGFLYCADIRQLPKTIFEILDVQNVKSILHCAIRDNGVFRGYVGFDECCTNRLWTKEQIDVLFFLSQMVSIFLLKKRAQDRTAMLAEDLNSVLDNQYSMIYVVDPDTYRLRFLNAKTREVAPEAREGMRCYEAIMGEKECCEDCPVKDIRSRKNQRMIKENRYLGLRVLAEGTLIRWSGEDACLLTCHDLTTQKPYGQKQFEK